MYVWQDEAGHSRTTWAELTCSRRVADVSTPRQATHLKQQLPMRREKHQVRRAEALEQVVHALARLGERECVVDLRFDLDDHLFRLSG